MEDLIMDTDNFFLKVHGCKLVIVLNSAKKIIIDGIMDDVIIQLLNNDFVLNKLNLLRNNLNENNYISTEIFESYLYSLTLKDLFLINENHLLSNLMGSIAYTNSLRNKPLSQVVKEFNLGDLFFKRNVILNLCINSSIENKLIATILFDLLTNDTNGKVDTKEQTQIYENLPWFIKQIFKESMLTISENINELLNADQSQISYENQICLLKTSNKVKEKAMTKLKEIKSKNDDNGSKAKTYLEGLLKIPFGNYKKEEILTINEKNNHLFKKITSNYNFTNIPIQQRYSNLEINKYLNELKNTNCSLLVFNEKINHELPNLEKKGLILIVKLINNFINTYQLSYKKIVISNKSNEFISLKIKNFIKDEQLTKDILEGFFNEVNLLFAKHPSIFNNLSTNNLNNEFITIVEAVDTNLKKLTTYMSDIKHTLDKSVYGHTVAKRQIEKIIAQWITGEPNGYCFGFEGPPGVGKTSLAKHGLALCLKDSNNDFRPFSMIQIGGDVNGSSLSGFNYTYVGSTWGKIVQILMDTKCMNPIIFIDEVDKISKTENGKEIISVLTHLLDSTQNDTFQDKYFSGIDLDLSKALFILSYNDVSLIDKVLLDRIHRIKFDNLTVDDKITISNNYILPEIYKKMGLENNIAISNETLEFIIDFYTNESGVRKLKEILFEIIGEINLRILKNENSSLFDIPITISIEDIKNKYLKSKPYVTITKISSRAKVGYINGLWANSIGQGGILPILASWTPSDQYMKLKLTGLQGDVMKESMEVASTLAISLTNANVKNNLFKNVDVSNKGIHIHCANGSVPKDGPSAGVAITMVLYSLLNTLKIKNDLAITGEINLDGRVSKIGGLDLKIKGGIKAGIKIFIVPKENEEDLQTYFEKNKDIGKDVTFHMVEQIEEVINLIFLDE